MGLGKALSMSTACQIARALAFWRAHHDVEVGDRKNTHTQRNNEMSERARTNKGLGPRRRQTMRFSRQYRALLVTLCQITAISAFSVTAKRHTKPATTPALFGMVGISHTGGTSRTSELVVLSMTTSPTSPTSPSAAAAAVESFIDSELRGAAMKLHTKSQAPKEGQATETTPPPKPHTTTHADYLQFLVDSLHVYEAMEDIVSARDELEMFRTTGLERTKALETDIEFMMKEYNLKRPSVGEFGMAYASALRKMESIPAFMCHYYNWYFAHTAGGRMIGKQISKLLLEGKTLEFYKVRRQR
jgi:hypothetical protein